MKIRMIAVAALLAHVAGAWANDDQTRYNQRGARTDLSLYRELDRAGNGLLTREDVRGDLNLGPRFDDIDTNRDGIVTLRELQAYIERTYGVLLLPN